MTLRRQVWAATGLMLLVPLLVLLLIFSFRNGGTVPGQAIMRFLFLQNWIKSTVSPGPDGRPVVTHTKVPPGMSQFWVYDASGRLVGGSTAEAWDPGLGQRFFWQSVARRGQVYGSVLVSYAVAPWNQEDGPDPLDWLLIFTLAFLGTAVVLGLWLGRVSNQVSRLERATQELIRGRWDLEVPTAHLGTTELRQLGLSIEALRQALVWEQRKRARFLAAVSHDLKTPLTSIQGYVEAIDDGLAEDPETRKRYLEVIRSKGQVLGDRVSDLLDYARAESEDWKPRKERRDLAAFVAGLGASLADDGKLLDQTLEVRVSGPFVTTFDPALVSRAVENLVNNAFRYSPPGGRVVLAFGVDDQGAWLTVTDQGPGIAPADLPYVFEPFFRGASPGQPGQGLGLFITRTICEGHRWTLSVTAPGRGAEFRIHIPPSS